MEKQSGNQEKVRQNTPFRQRFYKGPPTPTVCKNIWDVSNDGDTLQVLFGLCTIFVSLTICVFLTNFVCK